MFIDSPIVSCETLLKSDNFKIIDASWHMPNQNRDAHSEYNNAHIKNAVFFDLDKVTDNQSPYPHMLPSSDDFGKAIGDLGISNNDKIIVYDTAGLFSAARLWWMFRYFGHNEVYLLDGGLKKWLSLGFETTSETTKPEAAIFHAIANVELVTDFANVCNASKSGELIIDARSPSRFTAEEKEPRAGLKSGHIKNSHSFHYARFLNPDGTIIPDEKIKDIFANIDLGQKIIASCGSGVTACILALVLFKIGKKDVIIYDGSWAEFGALADDELIATGL